MAAVIIVSIDILFLLLSHITSVPGIIVTWKAIPYLLANVKFSTTSMCTLGIEAVRIVDCSAKYFVYLASSP